MSNHGRKRVLLLRHGETDLTPGRHFVGSTDLALSVTGRFQASAMSDVVLAHKPQRCLCSPMRRCLETADAVIGGSGLEKDVQTDLREIDFGHWEKLTFAEISKRDPEGAQRWIKFDKQFSFGDGERLGAFFSRVKREAARIVAAPEEIILIVAHGGVIRTMVCHFLGLSLRHYWVPDISPASLTVLDLFGTGKGVLASLTPCSYRMPEGGRGLPAHEVTECKAGLLRFRRASGKKARQSETHPPEAT